MTYTDSQLIKKYWEAAEDEMSLTHDIVDALIDRGLAYIRDATSDEINESKEVFGDFHSTTVLELVETNNIESLRVWQKSSDGWKYLQGAVFVGGVLITEYGTVCFSGPLGRGTAESVDGAKQIVEDMFDPDSAFAQIMKTAVSRLNDDPA